LEKVLKLIKIGLAARALTAQKLGEMVGTDKATMSRYLNGKREPSAAWLLKALEALGYTISLNHFDGSMLVQDTVMRPLLDIGDTIHFTYGAPLATGDIVLYKGLIRRLVITTSEVLLEVTNLYDPSFQAPLRYPLGDLPDMAKVVEVTKRLP